MSDPSIPYRGIILSHQLKSFRDSSGHDWALDFQDPTILLVEFVVTRTAPPPVPRQATSLTSRRDRGRSKSTSTSESLETPPNPYPFPADWPIDRSSLNRSVLELHRLLDSIAENPSFISFSTLFIETLPVRVIQRPLGPPPALLPDTPDIQLKRNFNSSIFE